MIKVKDGYAKLIGTTYSGSADRVLLSNGGDKAVSDFAAASALGDYVTLATAQTITGGKTFASTIYINSGNSITDEGGNGVLGVKSTTWTGIPSDGTAISLGTLNNSLYFRSSGDNMYHYRNDKGTSYKVLDAFNYNYYSPTLTGGGASGTWGINITGSASSADIWDGKHFVKSYNEASDIDWSSLMWSANAGCTDITSMSYAALMNVGTDLYRGWQIWNSRNDPRLYWRPAKGDASDWAEVRVLLDNYNYTTYLGYIGTTAVQSSSAVQALTGISRISNSTTANLYLGNSGNQGWVLTQDICSHSGSSFWAINVNGYSWFKQVNIGYTYTNTGDQAFNVKGNASITGDVNAGRVIIYDGTNSRLILKTASAGANASLSGYNTGGTYGADVVLNSGSALVLGAGESASEMYSNNVDSLQGSENFYLSADGYVKIFTNCDTIANRKQVAHFDTSGYAYFGSYINIGGHEKNASSPTYVWGSNDTDSFLRSYKTSSLSVKHASTSDYTNQAKSLEYKGLPSSTSNATNTVWCKFARITYNASAWCNAAGYFIFSGAESTDHAGILSYHFRSGSTATDSSINILEWLVKNRDTATVIAEKVDDNVYDLYINNYSSYTCPIIYHMTAQPDRFTWSVGSWTTAKPTAAFTSRDSGRVNYATTSTITGDGTITLLPQYGNEINIGGTTAAENIYIGYRASGSKPIPTSFVFGGSSGSASVTASKFIKSGGTEAQLLRADGGVATFNWSGQSGQPTWLWGGNDKNSYYVYNPANFNVNSAITSTVLLTNNTSQAADACYSEDPGLRFWRFNGTGNTVGGGDGWIMSWSWNPGSVGGQIYLDNNPSKIMAIRGFDNATKTFNAWSTFLHSTNYTDYTVKKDGTGASGTWGISISGTAANADKLDNIDSTGFLRNYSQNYSNTISNATDISPTLTVGVAQVHISNVEYSSVLTGYDFNNKAWQLRFRPSYNDGIYFRSQGTGTAWKKLAFTSDIPTSLPADGGNADTVDGYHAASFAKYYADSAYNADTIDDGIHGGKLYGASVWPLNYYAFLSVGYSNYKMQFNARNNVLYFRAGTEDGLSTMPWVNIIHSGNLASYALKNYGTDNSRPNGSTFILPGGTNVVSTRSGATSGADIGIFYLSDDNAFICNSSDNAYLFATFDTDKTADFSTSANAAFAVLSNHAGIQVKGAINSDLSTSSHLAGNQGTAIINSTASAGYNMLAKMNSTNGVFTMGMYNAAFDLYYTANTTINAGTNSITKGATLLDESGNSSFPGLVSTKSLSVVNDSCNNGTDALAYFQHRSNNDWTVKIDCGSYDYGLHINATGNNALLVGPGAARFTGSMIVGADVVPSYTLDVRSSKNVSYDFHIYNSTTKASLYVGNTDFWYGTSKTGTSGIFHLNSGCTSDGSGGTNVFKVSASGVVTASSYINATRFHLSNTAADYCGLMPNSVITTGGNAADIWLYNDNKVSIYGSSISLANNTTVSGYVSASGGFVHPSYGSSAYALTSDGGAAHIGSMSVNYATSAKRLNLVSCYNGTSNNDLWSTIKSSNNSYIGTATIYEVYNDGGPTTYGHVLDIVTVHSNHWQPQLWFDAGKGGRLRYRNKDYNNNSWGSWGEVAWTSDIPSVGNGTITIKQNGSLVGSFTTNQSTDATFDLTGGSTDTNYYPVRSYTSGLQISSYSGSTDCQLYVPNATYSQAGVVTTAAQTFAGEKTFASIRLRSGGTSNYGGYLYFGDGSYAYITEPDDDELLINAPTIYFGTSGTKKYFMTGSIFRPVTSNSSSTSGIALGASSYRFTYGYFAASVYAYSGFYESSDERLKRILNPVKVNLDDLSKLRKIYYLWNDKPEDGRQLGMIAQDIQKLYPELVSVDKETGYLSLAYDRLSVLALEAIDVLYKEHKKLKERVDELEKLLTNRGIL